MREVNPSDTNRGWAFDMWINSPMPMVTIFKTLDVTRLIKISKKHSLKFNMLMCYCTAKAVAQMEEFKLLPVGKKMIEFDKFVVSLVVENVQDSVSFAYVPPNDDLREFNKSYLAITREARELCNHQNPQDVMVFATSNVSKYEIDGAVNMYNPDFNNPFLVWSKCKKTLFKITTKASFQFNHIQMDGNQAAKFLHLIQQEIFNLKV